MISFIFCALAAIVLAPIAGRYLFRKRVARDITTLLSTTMSSVGPQQLAARLDSLPEPVRRYLRFAIADGAPATRTVRLEHGGTFRTKPEQRWLPIRGVECFTAATPGFVWSASIRPAPLIWIDACDRLHNRRGNMLVKLESLFTIADACGPEIDQGASLRWLAEAVWFPYAFAGDAIRWEPVSGEAARAMLIQEGAPVAATVEFDAAAAKRFFQKALQAPGHPRPRVITVDGNPSYPKVIAELKRERKLGRRCRCRTCPYLNNIVEQDHRGIKRRVNASQGFRSFEGAWRTIQGYEILHMIRKGQVRWLPKGDVLGQIQFIRETLGLKG